MQQSTRHITLSALFMALGILIPMIFHFAMLGPILLPMLWPIAASAFFLPMPYTLAVAVLTPCLSTLLTGMPPVSPPILHIMCIELAVLSTVTRVLYVRAAGMSPFLIMLVSVTVSRLALIASAAVLSPFLHLPPGMISLFYFVRSLPGAFILIIIIPLVLKRLSGTSVFSLRQKNV